MKHLVNFFLHYEGQEPVIQHQMFFFFLFWIPLPFEKELETLATCRHDKRLISHMNIRTFEYLSDERNEFQYLKKIKDEATFQSLFFCCFEFERPNTLSFRNWYFAQHLSDEKLNSYLRFWSVWSLEWIRIHSGWNISNETSCKLIFKQKTKIFYANIIDLNEIS